MRSGALSVFPTLLQHPKNNVMKEAAWAISNVAAGNTEQIQALIDNNVLLPIVNILRNVSFLCSDAPRGYYLVRECVVICLATLASRGH